MGYHDKDPYQSQPVINQGMTTRTSDFSLDEFITEAIKYHDKNAQNTRIIKLNFGTITSVQESIKSLLNYHREVYLSHVI